MTVALGLLAFKIAGDKAGAVLGTALAIKMVAYVGVAPVVGGFANLSAAAGVPGIDGPDARGGRDRAAVRRPGLAGLRPDLRAAGGLRRLHADVPGDHSGRASGGERLYAGALAVASRLRHGKPAQPDRSRPRC